MRLLFIGDVVGPPGLALLSGSLSALVARERIDFVIANGENASGGTGLTPAHYEQLRAAGVNLVTLGDHVYKKRAIIPVLQKEATICRPANFPPEAPGREYALATAGNGARIAAFCVLGRTFMRPVDCPFRAADRVLAALEGQADYIVVDAHAEATGDKYLLANHLDGRVTAILGTHTHVPTADEQILPRGTAYITDVGMTGPYRSILGRRVDRVLPTALTFVPTAFDVASQDVRLGAALVEIDASTRAATSITRLFLPEAVLPGRSNMPSPSGPVASSVSS